MVYDVTVSPKYQIVLPKEMRDKHGFQPGQKLRFVEWGGGLRLVPALALEDLYGLMPGLPPFEREEGEREFPA